PDGGATEQVVPAALSAEPRAHAPCSARPADCCGRGEWRVERVHVVLEPEGVEERLGGFAAVADQQLLFLGWQVELGGRHVRGVDRERAHAGGVADEARVPGFLRGVEDVEGEADAPGRDAPEMVEPAAETAAAGEREAEGGARREVAADGRI